MVRFVPIAGLGMSPSSRSRHREGPAWDTSIDPFETSCGVPLQVFDEDAVLLAQVALELTNESRTASS